MSKKSDALVKHTVAHAIPPRTDAWVQRMTPAADIYESSDAYVLVLEMPGAEKDSITLTVDGGTLAVNAPAGAMHGPDATLLHREIRTGAYHRAFKVGAGVDSSKIDALYEEGVLVVKLYKCEANKPKDIVIR